MVAGIHAQAIMPRSNFSGIPGALADRAVLGRACNRLDGVLARCLGPIAQNAMLCARDR